MENFIASQLMNILAKSNTDSCGKGKESAPGLKHAGSELKPGNVTFWIIIFRISQICDSERAFPSSIPKHHCTKCEFKAAD